MLHIVKGRKRDPLLCGAYGSRTRDLQIANLTLYQTKLIPLCGCEDTKNRAMYSLCPVF